MRRAALACAAALASACAAHAPPRLSADVPLEEEERRMWRDAEEARRQVERGGTVVEDAALEAYLLSVARRLEPPGAFEAIPFRIRILRDRQPNAFCLPNGAIYVDLGMLALLESEAELAVLLAHEMTHATHRHALRHLRSANRSGVALATLGAVIGAGASGGRLLAVVSSGYGRDLEREADAEGLTRVAAAGYDVAEGVRMFERMRDWAAEEKVPQGPAMYASHPRMTERLESCRELIAARGATGGVRNAEAYAANVAPVLLAAARLELAAGRYAAARRVVERQLALRPGEAAAHTLLGEIVRREGAAGADEAALASYRRATELDPAAAEAWRGMGLVLQRCGRRDEARAAFARYLELAPGASDAAHVRAAMQAAPGGTP